MLALLNYFGALSIYCTRRDQESSRKLAYKLHKICKNTGFYRPVFSRIDYDCEFQWEDIRFTRIQISGLDLDWLLYIFLNFRLLYLIGNGKQMI